jgi:hypothetical protein
MVRDIGVVAVVFVVVTAIAAALGAANLGTAATFGQVAAIVAAAVVILRG